MIIAQYKAYGERYFCAIISISTAERIYWGPLRELVRTMIGHTLLLAEWCIVELRDSHKDTLMSGMFRENHYIAFTGPNHRSFDALKPPLIS